MEAKTKLVKVRVTPDEFERLSTLAKSERENVSAFIRKQVFGRQADAILHLARIHSNLLEIARGLKAQERPLQLSEALSYLVATERNVNDLLVRFQGADRVF